MAAIVNRMREVFLEAVEKPLADRPAYLAQACGADDELRRRVELLLHAHENPDNVLDRPAVEQFCADGAVGAPGADGATLARVPVADASAAESPPVAGDVLVHLARSTRVGSLGRLGQYEMLEVLGRGGFATVFKAFDEKLHRVVAVKVLAPELAASGSARQRFLREARAAAAVRHEHVINIHAIEEQPLPYLVMEFIDGQTLQQKLERNGPLPVNEILRIGLQIAEGLAAAHKQGLIHRDVKPANILLENGVERVKLSDFGLARTADDASLTRSGVVAGTPLYMSPEQADGKLVDQRTDIFSLGSVLYALCTGHPPFRADGTVAVLMRVCSDTPRPIRDINRDIPDWLAAVVDKLLAKRPEERFPSAQAVADVLGHYLSDLQLHGAVVASHVPADSAGEATRPMRPVNRLSATPRRRRRTPVIVGLSAVGAIAIALFGIHAWWPRASETESGPSPAAQLPPDPLDQHNRDEIAPALLALARGGDAGQAPAELVAMFAHGEGRPAESGASAPVAVSLPPVHTVAVSPDGQWLATGGGDRVVKLWNLQAWQKGEPAPPAETFAGHTETVWSVRFSPDGKVLASGSPDGSIILWEVTSGKRLHTLWGHSKTYSRIAFSPDGQVVSAGCDDGAVRTWDVNSGKLKSTVPTHDGAAMRCVAYSPDGKLLASGGTDKAVRVYDIETGRFVQIFHLGNVVDRVAFTPDGARLAATTDSTQPSTLNFWDVETWRHASYPSHNANVPGLAFSPTSPLAATSGGEGIVRFWDLRGEQPRSRLLGPGPFGRWAAEVAFTPDGRYLATANYNGTISIFQAPALAPEVSAPRPEPVPTPKELAAKKSPADALDRSTLPAALPAPADMLPELVAVLGGVEGHSGQVYGVAIRPDGQVLASAGQDRSVRLWALGTGRFIKALTGFPKRVYCVGFSPNGKLLATGDDDGQIQLWDGTTFKELRALKGHSGCVSAIAFSPDGRWLASGAADGTLRLWDTDTGKATRVLADGAHRPWSISFSPDGKTLAASLQNGVVQLWDIESGWEIARLTGHTPVWIRSVAFSPDGRTLASSSYDGKDPIRLWNLSDRALRQTLAGHTAAVIATAWDPTGRLLASIGDVDGTVRVWDTSVQPARCKVLSVVAPGERWLHNVAFVPDGRHLATANPDGTIYILRLAEQGKTVEIPDSK